MQSEGGKAAREQLRTVHSHFISLWYQGVILLHNVDYHVHSSFSDGRPDYRQILDRAKELELGGIAITDHFDRYDADERTSSITDGELLRHFDAIRAYGDKINQKVLCGIETCTDFKGNLRLTDRVIKSCDIIITSPHYVEYDGELVPGEYYNERFWDRYKSKVLNMAKGPGDILGHCEAYLPYGKLLVPNTTTYEQRMALARSIAEKFFDEEYIKELIKAVKISGKAIELHCVTSTPRESVIKRLVESGVSLSLGSDSHSLSGVGNTAWGISMLKKFHGEALQFIK